MAQVECWGQGDPVVLIHGSPGNSLAWKAVAERLAGRFRLLAPTLPGHGAAAVTPVASRETPELAAEIEAALGAIEAPVVLAAHSYGGNVALQLALRGRLRLRRLVLFEPVTVGALLAAGDAAAYAEVEAVFGGYVRAVEAGDRGAVATMIDFWFGSGAFARLPGRMQDYLRAGAPTNARDVAAGFRERFAPGELRRIDAPAVVAVGGASPPIAGRIGRAVAAGLADARVVTIPGAGHAMLTTHPAEVAALIAG